MQYRTVIVDDEIASRNTVKEYLAGSDFYVVQDFSSPLQALEWFECESADIVIADMNMPKMSGSEFMRILKLTTGSDMILLAISGYDDFEYARECIGVGVEDYLLKHNLTRQSLLRTLQTAVTRFGKTPHAPMSDIGFLKTLLQKKLDLTQQEELARQIHLDKSNLVLMVFQADIVSINRNIGFVRQQNNITLALLDIVRQMVGSHHKSVCECVDNGEVEVLISFQDVVSQNYILSYLSTLLGKMRNTALRLLNVTLSVGISEILLDIAQIHDAYADLTHVLKNRFYEGKSYTYTSISKAPGLPRAAVGVPLKDSTMRLLQYELCNYEAARAYEVCQGIFDEARRENWDATAVELLAKELANTISDVLAQRGTEDLCATAREEFSYYQFITQYKECFRGLCSAAAGELQRSAVRYSTAVSAAVEYIQQNYAENISLESCADAVGASYTHLSRIFAAETGEKFNEFLTRVRLERAKALILSGKYRFSDIYQMTGFGSYNYFFKVFKKSEKITPSDFAAMQNVPIRQ